MILATADALTELAKSWEDDARTHQRYDPADPKARVLARCAEDLRRTLGATSPEWVPVASVQQWTGWSRPTLRRRCRDELEARGLARKSAGREWEVALAAALEWPVRTAAHVNVAEVGDLTEFARLMGREE